jgi:hypothetical protein
VIAKVGRQKITEAQFTEYLKGSMGKAKLDQEEKQKNIQYLNRLIESKLLRIAAKEAGLMKIDELTQRENSLEKRVVQRLYQNMHLKENGGLKIEELESYYNANRNKFKDDSNKVIPFDKAKEKVVDTLLLAKANLDSFYLANKPSYTKVKKDTVIEGQDTIVKGDSVLPPLSENYEKVSKRYVRSYKNHLVSNMKTELFTKYGVEFKNPKPEVDDKSLNEYYEKNKTKFQSNETFDIYHIEMDSEQSIKSKLKGVKSLEQFTKVAEEFSLNPWTKTTGGKVGKIKKTFCLPYGIGMFPRLFPMLDSLDKMSSSFKVTVPLENPQTKRWHVFVLIKKYPKQVKSLERVNALVKENYMREKGKTLPQEAVLAVYGKDGEIKEKDVKRLRSEIPPQYQKRYTRNQLVNYLALWELAYNEAKLLGLTEQMRVKVAIVKEKDSFWAKTYQDSVVKNTFGQDTTLLKEVFNKNKPLFVQDTSQPYQNRLNHDIAIYISLDSIELELEYHIHPDKYMKDSVAKSYDEAKYTVFQNLKRVNRQKPRKKMIEGLKKKYGVKILDSRFKDTPMENSGEAFKIAQNLHNDRKLDEALKQYKKVREAFKGKDYETLRDSICMAMAQVYVEKEKYKEALSEYRRLLFLYPKSPNNYKAQFMIGFIYAENLKNDKLAIQAFKVLLEKYPNCDLADDADWMVRNIESGGALMPVLEDG